MSAESKNTAGARRLRGGIWGPLTVLVFALCGAGLFYGVYLYPESARGHGHQIPFNQAMFGPKLEQPIPFSHRLHVTDKEIDCFYCHSFPERSMNAGLPAVDKCLGCHNTIIPEHDEILKLKAYKAAGKPLPWVRVYYNPDHVHFPHYRHLAKGVACEECHGEVEQADRLNQGTFYMGFCLRCHDQRGATRECVACHQ